MSAARSRTFFGRVMFTALVAIVVSLLCTGLVRLNDVQTSLDRSRDARERLSQEVAQQSVLIAAQQELMRDQNARIAALTKALQNLGVDTTQITVVTSGSAKKPAAKSSSSKAPAKSTGKTAPSPSPSPSPNPTPAPSSSSGGCLLGLGGLLGVC
jgi:type II secretory pathway pseudopilin PulG